jgi:predicted glycosyltransferase
MLWLQYSTEKPNITFDDTEHNVFNHRIYTSFSDAIFTPEFFKKNFSKNHFRFKGTMDSAYLHPAYFKPRDVEFLIEQTNSPVRKKSYLE